MPQYAVRRVVPRGAARDTASRFGMALLMRLRTALLTFISPCFCMLFLRASMMFMTCGAGLPSGSIVTPGARFSTFARRYPCTVGAGPVGAG